MQIMTTQPIPSNCVNNGHKIVGKECKMRLPNTFSKVDKKSFP